MKQIIYREKGAPEVMVVEERPVPAPSGRELLVRIDAAGIAFGDVLRRAGRHYPIPTELPHAPGGSVAGMVEAVGDRVDGNWVGQRVHGYVTSGGYAQYGVGPVENFAILPDGVSAVDAVAIIPDATTASIILRRAGQLERGQSVFIPAAAGGLGSMLLRLARIYGAGRIIAGASTAAKREIALQDGADIAIDYTRDGWSSDLRAANDGAGVDLALETVGGATFHETVAATKNGGRIVNYGNASDVDAPINPRALLRRNLTLSGVLAGPGSIGREAALKEVLELVRAGKLAARLQTYVLEDAPRAHDKIEARENVGRQVLTPHGPQAGAVNGLRI